MSGPCQAARFGCDDERGLCTRTALLTLVISLLGAAMALGQQPIYRVESPYDWPMSTPQAQGVDPAVIGTALEAGEALPYLYALLVVKNGVLIGERYYGGREPTDATTVMSVSKSFLSALVGLAQREGFLDIDQPMLDSFPEYASGLDPRKFEITIRHLLTMTGGYPPDEYTSEWDRWLASPDWVGYCLRQPLEDNPGEAWHYSTCSTHIVSALITRATDMSTREFAEEYLFKPLGIKIGGWRRDPHGNYRGGWDMYFTPRDLARFGHLYRKKGKLDGVRVVPRRWVRKTTRSNVRGSSSWGSLDRWGYGYWWWTGNGPEIYKLYFGLGYSGQFVINVPKLKLTVVATADGNQSPEAANVHERAIMGLIIDYLLVPLREAEVAE